MLYSAIVLAAGRGTRTNLDYNKVFYKLGEQTVIEQTLRLFVDDEECKQIILVVSDHEKQMFEKLILSDKVEYAFGGETRQDSVGSGLKKVVSEYVMIHDGARPYIKKRELNLLKECLVNEDACLLMVPLIDTIKEVKDGYVVTTPNRNDFYAAQTPQCFKTSLIQTCYSKLDEGSLVVSDDASIVELYSNVKVKVVEGSYQNKKITTKEDL